MGQAEIKKTSANPIPDVCAFCQKEITFINCNQCQMRFCFSCIWKKQNPQKQIKYPIKIMNYCVKCKQWSVLNWTQTKPITIEGNTFFSATCSCNNQLFVDWCANQEIFKEINQVCQCGQFECRQNSYCLFKKCVCETRGGCNKIKCLFPQCNRCQQICIEGCCKNLQPPSKVQCPTCSKNVLDGSVLAFCSCKNEMFCDKCIQKNRCFVCHQPNCRICNHEQSYIYDSVNEQQEYIYCVGKETLPDKFIGKQNEMNIWLQCFNLLKCFEKKSSPIVNRFEIINDIVGRYCKPEPRQ